MYDNGGGHWEAVFTYMVIAINIFCSHIFGVITSQSTLHRFF